MIKRFDVDVIEPGQCDYALATGTPAELRAVLETAQGALRSTLAGIITFGASLAAAKRMVAHGEFSKLLEKEFGLKERKAQVVISVAARFGGKAQKFALLPIDPSAAYLLAAPSTPEEAVSIAIARAERGETIRVAIAKRIIAEVKGDEEDRPRKPLTELVETSYRHWLKSAKADELAQLPSMLKQLADRHGKSTTTTDAPRHGEKPWANNDDR